MPFNGFELTDDLRNFDVFPKVLVKDKPVVINIRPTGGRPVFEAGKEYNLLICALDQGRPSDYPATGSYEKLTAVCNENGGFDIAYTFTSEQMYFIRFLDDEDERIIQFPVYCVDSDLAGRYPLRGDLHMHTNRSDGRQIPAVVCANYRAHGLDFIVVSDHNRYYPSLEAIEAYKDVNIGLNIVPGEEVHMPKVNGQKSDFHIVNFGGKYSINALTDGPQKEEVGTDKKYRSIDGNCPEFTPLAQWEEKMLKLADEMDVPDNIDAIPAAVCKWVFDEIRKAEGLGIFPHPTWINDVFHVPEVFVKYITDNKFFDAFEVLGGENYYEHNGFQTLKYYEDKAAGINYPIVGSTDSHSSYPSNRNAFICSTMVFSKLNERAELIKSIKDYYSVAIDTINEDFRLVGSRRLVKYTTFLLKNYFPLHDEICKEEGRLMRQYVIGTDEEKAEAKEALKLIGNRVEKHHKKYFDF